jgi:predicted TIM-barrel fold metal-dependent hydrolase
MRVDRVEQAERKGEYIQKNLYVTPSGMWSQSYLKRTLELVGPERILFSIDYPYQYRPGGAGLSFLNEAAPSPEEKELFAHGNWERLTK